MRVYNHYNANTVVCNDCLTIGNIIGVAERGSHYTEYEFHAKEKEYVKIDEDYSGDTYVDVYCYLCKSEEILLYKINITESNFSE